MPQTIEREISFTPEMAGKRVGWVSTAEIRNGTPVETTPISVNVVSATVGPDGAWFGHRTSENPGDKPIAEQEGFLAVAAFSAILVSPTRNKWEEEFNLAYLHQGRRDASQQLDRSGGRLLDRGVDRGQYSNEDISVDWAKGPDELIDLLKEKLNDAGFKARYPQLYYWLNGTIARTPGSQLTAEGFEGISIDDLLLPDKKMQRTTRGQLERAQYIVELLGHSAKDDERMRKRLTVFSDVSAARIPDVFVENRRYVAGIETRILEHVSKLAVRQLVHLPIGNRSGGRTWPYMDASEADDGAAFGIELDALKRNSTERADHELAKEHAELRQRQQYAQKGLRRFNEIVHAEAA